jgi:hypothetical protein
MVPINTQGRAASPPNGRRPLRCGISIRPMSGLGGERKRTFDEVSKAD